MQDVTSSTRTEPNAAPSSFHEIHDVLVVGAGAGGMSTAVTAAHRGLDVVVLERAARCGGATSRSGGWMWTPRTRFARMDDVDESLEDIKSYLRAALGEDYDESRTHAFLEAAPEMVSFFQEQTRLQFTPGTRICDIYGDLPHAGTGHRSVGPAPFNGRRLPRKARKLLQPQYWETSFLGMGIMAGPDLQGFLAAAKFKPSGWWHSARRVVAYVLDLLTTGQGQHWVNGTALMGRLMLSALEADVDVRTQHRVVGLISDRDGRVIGAEVDTPRGPRRLGARRGVVLATGGFSADPALRQRYFPHNASADDHFTLAPATADGSGIRLGEAVGGVLDASGAAAGAWCPVSLYPYANGRTGVFPHIMDRAKPGTLSVRRDGRRFVNEANGYWDYVTGLNAATPQGEQAEAWHIADARAAARYPVGFAMPRPVPKTPFLRSGYLVKADSLPELAQRCGIDPDELTATVAEYNAAARRGEDPAFHRGATPFNRYGGDPEVKPNPSLAPLEKAPFYAVRVRQGSFGTFAGLRADERARLLDAHGAPVPGVYVVGVDQKNVLGGHYPAGGVNLGPAMTFGYLAAQDLATSTPATL